ncbi:class II fructose-bisphosphate aldolase [cf. Phormidesmis sp. LEGE 11477]|uniref:class II fructose-bisphosphate aldolase n=1 Tax=cf. Phormidesmis sp. LEGE 11477 TaxID=1828680 RepID=UPI00187E3378|nr:class II fructose-bisphosphate aldolase [cf. Phormidesmis sp. LEGE 11477]MBE9062525.1 class II fructose-bisphosphate aldolase [cf. Phormidesmis sp. LEGE 11477]
MLTSTKELLETAQKHSYAVGAFNLYNLEGVKAVVKAAEADKSPAIIQVLPHILEYGGSPLIALLLEAADSATVPMSVHLDHCEDRDIIKMALAAGVQSVLADGSKFSYQENLAFTREMTVLAHAQGATVEAEIGRISGTEDGMTVAEKEAKMTDPYQAKEFVEESGVDFLAVTIGNVHGKYHSEPRLDFGRLAKVRQQLQIPLVLHGASGLPALMIQQSIELGVSKFNVNTEVRQKYLQFWREYGRTNDQTDLLDCQKVATGAMQAVIAQKIRLFGSAGKAQHVAEENHDSI